MRSIHFVCISLLFGWAQIWFCVIKVFSSTGDPGTLNAVIKQRGTNSYSPTIISILHLVS